jgi:hypothetical protein
MEKDTQDKWNGGRIYVWFAWGPCWPGLGFISSFGCVLYPMKPVEEAANGPPPYQLSTSFSSSPVQQEVW